MAAHRLSAGTNAAIDIFRPLQISTGGGGGASWDSPANPSGDPAVDNYVSGLETKSTPIGAPEDIYEIQQTGPTNYRLKSGDERVWIDGYKGKTILESKYIGNPDRSPFIPESRIPDVVRQQIVNQMRDEFRRLGIMVQDSNIPFDSVEVITNNAAAKPFFENLLQEFGTPGKVTVK